MEEKLSTAPRPSKKKKLRCSSKENVLLEGALSCSPGRLPIVFQIKPVHRKKQRAGKERLQPHPLMPFLVEEMHFPKKRRGSNPT